jgi:hypothetical protein
VGPEALTIDLCQRDGTLVRRLVKPGWLARLAGPRRELVEYALAGLDCLSAADFTTTVDATPVTTLPVEPIGWADWRDAWERERA